MIMIHSIKNRHNYFTNKVLIILNIQIFEFLNFVIYKLIAITKCKYYM